VQDDASVVFQSGPEKLEDAVLTHPYQYKFVTLGVERVGGATELTTLDCCGAAQLTTLDCCRYHYILALSYIYIVSL